MAIDPARTAIYHITDVANLPAILAQGGLISDAAMIAQRREPASRIAFEHIKARRRAKRIPGAGNRTVHEFVPFYYCPRSPMLFTVNQGNTGKPVGYQSQVLHLVSSAARGAILGRAWAISGGNAGADYEVAFFHELADLERLDWEVIRSNDWGGDRLHRKQAEFLVADFFPWEQLVFIGCHNEAIAAQVGHLLAGAAHVPRVEVRPHWYYP